VSMVSIGLTTESDMHTLEPQATDFIREISPRDAMFGGDESAYFDAGRSALECVGLALASTHVARPTRILDLPCGHGRTLRALKAGFPGAELIACDIDPDGVDFCARVLGALPVPSHFSPEHVEIPGKVELIWCGSLLTHLDSFRWHGFLALFERSLAPDGVLVFTTHGRKMAEKLRAVTLRDFVRPTANLLADYERYGFAYSDYPRTPREYGISLSSPDWVRALLEERPGLRLLSYQESAWGMQDVIACVSYVR
jgi:SAM-dependent methyltransferase